MYLMSEAPVENVELGGGVKREHWGDWNPKSSLSLSENMDLKQKRILLSRICPFSK